MDAKDKRIAELEALVKKLLERIAVLEKNSKTSSKNPSSDIVKPQKPKPKDENGNIAKRKIGAQKGHKQNLRKPITPELIDTIVKLDLTNCPDCGHKLTLQKTEPKITQQIELVEKPVSVTEYQQLKYWCRHCQKYHSAPLPKEIIKSGLFGPKLTTLTAYLKGRCHTSYRTLKDFMHDVLGVEISTGFLAKEIKKVAASLASPYNELAELLKQQEHLYADETSFKKNGKLQWAWCFVAEYFTFFKIAPSRGSQVLYEVLGEDFFGTISSDFYSAYLKYRKETETLFQFCWSHLIREIKFLTTLSDTKTYGKRLLKYVKRMFKTIHSQSELSQREFRHQMRCHRENIRYTVQRNVPENKKSEVLAKRFREHGASYFLFIDTQSIEPTNNVAEREIRTLVLDRHVTQGSRSVAGNEWNERFWSVVSTCRQQGRNLIDFLERCVTTYLYGGKPPTLVPAVS